MVPDWKQLSGDWIVETEWAKDAGDDVRTFRSVTIPDRHCWVDSYFRAEHGIAVDLEDWSDDSEWDNAIYRVTVQSTADLCVLVKAWFDGEPPLEELFVGLNKTSEIVTRLS